MLTFYAIQTYKLYLTLPSLYYFFYFIFCRWKSNVSHQKNLIFDFKRTQKDWYLSKEYIEINFRLLVVCALTWGDFSKMFQKRNFWHILHEGTILSNASTLIFRFNSLNLRRAFFFSPSPDFELPRSWLLCFSSDSTLFSSFEIFCFKSYNISSSSLR